MLRNNVFTLKKFRNRIDGYVTRVGIYLGMIFTLEKFRNLMGERSRVGIPVMSKNYWNKLEERVPVVKTGKIEIGKFYNFKAEMMQFLKNWVAQKTNQLL